MRDRQRERDRESLTIYTIHACSYMKLAQNWILMYHKIWQEDSYIFVWFNCIVFLPLTSNFLNDDGWDKITDFVFLVLGMKMEMRELVKPTYPVMKTFLTEELKGNKTRAKDY